MPLLNELFLERKAKLVVENKRVRPIGPGS